jgi:hypothetical protein
VVNDHALKLPDNGVVQINDLLLVAAAVFASRVVPFAAAFLREPSILRESLEVLFVYGCGIVGIYFPSSAVPGIVRAASIATFCPSRNA